MAQLDALIGALVKYSAQTLELAPGQPPILTIAGARRSISKQALEAIHIASLLREVAPADQQPAIASGNSTTMFVYTVDGAAMRVELAPGPRALIRPAEAAPAAAAPTPAPARPVAPTAGVGRRFGVSPSSTLVDLLRCLFDQKGSDLHVSSGSVPMMRIDGEMVPIDGLSLLDAGAAERLLLQIATTEQRDRFREAGDADFAYEIAGVCRFRCNLFQDRNGPGGVFRVIPAKILTADDLGLSKAIRDLCFLTKGLVLVTGPTGSGKSTTLAALVDATNRQRHDHIITIEDPIEFVHQNQACLVNQREVGVHTRSFKAALRAALREDPDIVLVGEMRDLETVSIALETAETGHLVFGTLHTCSAISTVDRLIDQFPADQQAQVRIMLSESLKAVVAQVLCKKIGGGRAAALEVLLVTPAVSNLIREGKTFQIPSLMQTGRGMGMVLMNDALIDLVSRKVVEPREAYAKAVDKASLLATFKSKGIDPGLPA
jgi:twitching motility protein PilT